MIRLLQLGKRADRGHLPVGQHGDAVAIGVKRIEIVRDHEHGQAERIAQAPDQGVELLRSDRVEPGRGFVEEEQFRIERDRSGDARPLAHPARQFSRLFCTRRVREAR